MLRIILASVLLVLTSTALADEWTGLRAISSVRVEGQAGSRTVYFETATTWGAPGCSGAKFVFARDIEGLQDLLAVGLAAKLGERIVGFVGTCQNSEYFQAHYIYIE